MEKSDYVRRVMAYEESEEAHKLVADEDWNLTLAKFKMLAKLFPSNIFVTIKRETKEIVAVISATPTHPGQCVVGNLVVRHDHRSLGLGKAMLLYLLETTQPTGTFTLTAVPGTFAFYNKIGFQDVGPSHHVSYVMVDRAGVQKACSQHNADDVIISKYGPSMFQTLSEYDMHSRGYDGGLYLSIMTDVSDTFLVATSKSSGEVVGFAAGVDEESLLLVDGLYADNDGIALQLYSTLLDAYPKQKEIKLQEIQPKPFLTQFGETLPKSHSYTRMATRPTAPVLLSKLYVVCDCDYSE